MVHLTLPSTEEEKNNHKSKTGLNGVDEDMASRLAALAKAIKERIPHKNGVIGGTSMKARKMKTEAKPTCVNGLTLPNGSGHHKESSSEYITKHCKGLLKKTTSHLATSQSVIETRVANSLQALRHRQLTISHEHAAHQLECQQHSIPDSLSKLYQVQDQSNEATPPSGSPNTSLGSTHSSADVCLTSPCIPDSSSHESMGLSTFGIQKHLQGLGSFVDDEATCSSSDEEEDDLSLQRKHRFKQSK